MKCLVLLWVCSVCILSITGCTGEEIQENQILTESATGSIRGNISPIDAYDAQVRLLRDEETIAVVGVQDGIFEIDNLLPTHTVSKYQHLAM